MPYRARVNKIERERERREFFLSASGAYIVIFRSLTLQASLQLAYLVYEDERKD